MEFKKIKIENACIKINLILFLFTMTITIASCGVNRGHFGIGKVRVLNPDKTEASLESQLTTVKEKVKNIDPFKTNQGHLRSSNLSQRGEFNFAAPGPDGATTSPENVEQQKVESAEAIVTVAVPTEFKGLVMDGFTSAESFSAHKIDIEEDFDIETMGKGEDGEIYKLKFDLWIEPERQNYWSYSYRWIPAIFGKHGFRNYTKDYHAEIKFTLKDDAEVVLVQPVNEGINSYEMVLLQQTSQLAAGGTWQGIAAEIDLAERHREQFMEQRKNPILRGIVDSDSEFHFIISPRQYVAQRTFRIPFFMSRYTIERGLESGPYPVSAYILVRNKHKKDLEIKVCGNYKMFGDAHKHKPIYKDGDKTDYDKEKTRINYGIKSKNG